MAAIITVVCAMTCIQYVHAATTILVTSTADDGSPGTLRVALAAANDGDTIDATGINGTITLLPDFLTSSQLIVAKSVTILGPGPDKLTIDGNHTSRVFHIGPGHTVTIEGLAIVNGRAAGSFPANAGGGIYNDHSVLRVDFCVISGNSARDETNFIGSGGGIFNNGMSSGNATLTVVNSVVSGNSADEFGGIGNSASGTGNATLVVEHSTISGNSASTTGGIGNAAIGGTATASINASTISGNSATNSTGAAINNGLGGVATLTLSNSTVTANVVLGEFADHAGLYNLNGGTARISSCTFSGNSLSSPARHGGAITSSATLEIGNTILRAGSIGENLFGTSGQIISRGFNLSSDDGGGHLIGTSDRILTDPLLGPLADNGGPTLTHLPAPGSLAIDKGSSDTLVALGITTDQRGFARTVDDPAIDRAFLGDNTDIGAVEVQAAPLPPPPEPLADVAISFLGADKTSVKQGEELTYTLALQNFGPNTAPNVVVNDILSSSTVFRSARATKGSFTAPPVNETGAVTWAVGDLPNGGAEGAQLVVTVVVKGKTTITNLATINSAAVDPNAENNVASITTAVGPGGSEGSTGGGGGGKKK